MEIFGFKCISRSLSLTGLFLCVFLLDFQLDSDAFKRTMRLRPQILMPYTVYYTQSLPISPKVPMHHFDRCSCSCFFFSGEG